MAYFTGDSYPFGYRAVQDKVPPASGVYVIFTPRKWLYVGESDDMRQSLYGHLNDRDVQMARFGALSFSFETAPPAERLARQRSLIAQLKPVVN